MVQKNGFGGRGHGGGGRWLGDLVKIGMGDLRDLERGEGATSTSCIV
jgi:hypothetical protein